ncbi:MAG: cytochrome b/b6 domain-containing protein [Candidatus Eisenbacteria bacterium]|nr:cytochrome b/b6 domain-containing protein [Candidatus Eisenbacteria bacterium]
MNARERLVTIYLYTRFERFWHWVQAALILTLILTGLEIHGTFTLLGFDRAVEIHNFVGVSWLILFVFIVFWLLTTGEWKQYIPTSKRMYDVVCHYSIGIFQGKPHPIQKCVDRKHNPVQRLVYLTIAAILLPIQMVTGLLYFTYNHWEAWGIDFLGLAGVASVHMIMAFFLLAYLVVHLYMTTTGHTLSSHIAAMWTGRDLVVEGTTVEDWERAKDKT